MSEETTNASEQNPPNPEGSGGEGQNQETKEEGVTGTGTSPSSVTQQTLAEFKPFNEAKEFLPKEWEVGDDEAKGILEFVNKNKIGAAERLGTFLYERAKAQEVADTEAAKAAIEGWRKDLFSRQNFKGEEYEKSRAQIFQVLKTYGSAELDDFLRKSGGEWYPPMLEFVLRLAGEVPAKPSPVNAGGQQRAKAQPWLEMYPPTGS